ncbi:unnamed protein product [Parajaminaea phylloscopi]
MASKPWRLPSQEPPASSKAPTSTTRKLSEFLRRPSLVAWQKSSTSTDVVPAPKWQRNMSVPDIRPMQGYPAISAPMPSDAHRSQWPGPRLHPERRPSNAVDTGSEVGPTSFALPGCCPSDSLAPEFSSLNTIPPVSLIPLPCAQLPSNPRNDHQPSYDVESGFGRGTLPPPSVRLSEYQWAKVPIQSASKTQVVVSPPPSLASQLLRKASRQIGDALFALDEVADIYASEKGATEADGVDKGPRTLDELRELRDALAMLQDGFQTGSFSAIVEAQKSQRANPRSIPRKPCPDVQRTTAARKIATATGNEGTVSSSKLRSSSRDTASRSVSESSESEHYSMMSKSTRLTSQTSLTEPEIRPATASERGAKGAPGDPAVRRRPSEAAFAQGWQQGWTFNGGANGTADPLTVAKDWNMRDVDIGHKKLDHSIPVYGSLNDACGPGECRSTIALGQREFSGHLAQDEHRFVREASSTGPQRHPAAVRNGIRGSRDSETIGGSGSRTDEKAVGGAAGRAGPLPTTLGGYNRGQCSSAIAIVDWSQTGHARTQRPLAA